MSTSHDDGVINSPINRVHGNARQIQRREHVGVTQFSTKAQTEEIEVPHRAVRINGELRNVVFAHQLF